MLPQNGPAQACGRLAVMLTLAASYAPLLAAAAGLRRPASNMVYVGRSYRSSASDDVQDMTWFPAPLPGDVPFKAAASTAYASCMLDFSGSAYCLVSQGHAGLQAGVGRQMIPGDTSRLTC